MLGKASTLGQLTEHHRHLLLEICFDTMVIELAWQHCQIAPSLFCSCAEGPLDPVASASFFSILPLHLTCVKEGPGDSSIHEIPSHSSTLCRLAGSSISPQQAVQLEAALPPSHLERLSTASPVITACQAHHLLQHFGTCSTSHCACTGFSAGIPASCSHCGEKVTGREEHRTANSAPVSPVATLQSTMPYSRHTTSQPGNHDAEIFQKGVSTCKLSRQQLLQMACLRCASANVSSAWPDTGCCRKACACCHSSCLSRGMQSASFCQHAHVGSPVPGDVWSPRALDKREQAPHSAHLRRPWEPHAAFSKLDARSGASLRPCGSHDLPATTTAAATIAAWPQRLSDAHVLQSTERALPDGPVPLGYNTSAVHSVHDQENVPCGKGMPQHTSSQPCAARAQKRQASPSLLNELGNCESTVLETAQQPLPVAPVERGYRSSSTAGRCSVGPTSVCGDDHACRSIPENRPGSRAASQSGELHAEPERQLDVTLSHPQPPRPDDSQQNSSERPKRNACGISREQRASLRTSWAPNFLAATKSSRARAQLAARLTTGSAAGNSSRSSHSHEGPVTPPLRPSALTRMRRLESEPHSTVSEQLQKKPLFAQRSRRSCASLSNGESGSAGAKAAGGPFPQAPSRVSSQLHLRGPVVEGEREAEVQRLQQSLGRLDLRHDELLREVANAGDSSERCVCWISCKPALQFVRRVESNRSLRHGPLKRK